MLSRREEAPIVLEDERYTNGCHNDISRNILNVSKIHTAEINVLTAGIIVTKEKYRIGYNASQYSLGQQLTVCLCMCTCMCV